MEARGEPCGRVVGKSGPGRGTATAKAEALRGVCLQVPGAAGRWAGGGEQGREETGLGREGHRLPWGADGEEPGDGV